MSAHGLNNPVKYKDPTGHYVVDASTGAYDCVGLAECEWDAEYGGELSGTCGADCGWVVGSNGVRQEYSLLEAAAEVERGVRAVGYGWTGVSVVAGFVGADVFFDGAEVIYCLVAANSSCLAFAAASFVTPGISAAAARHASGSGGRIVYRALSEMDARDIANGHGILSTGWEEAHHQISHISHVAGRKPSIWISTGTNAERIREVFDSGNGIAVIDLAKVQTEIVDLSTGIPGYERTMLSNWAMSFGEVLVKHHIVPEAIIEIWD